ncbi:MAG: Fe-S cluster assembly protein SufD [Polaribacter sp.]|jgi:Fe-S cluster assembly protein SufD
MTDVNLTLVKELPKSPFYLADLIDLTIPTRKSEDWKYNDVYFLKTEQFEFSKIIKDVDKVRVNIQEQTSLKHDYLAESNLLVFVDGNYSDELSRITEKNDLSFNSPSNLTSEQLDKISIIENKYGEEKNPIVSLTKSNLNSDSNNTNYVKLKENVKLKNPLYIIHYATSSSGVYDNSFLSINKLILDLSKSSESTIVEIFISSEKIQKNDNSQLAVQATLVNVEENANAEHYRFNLESNSHKQISNLSHLLNKNAVLNSFLYSNGSLLNKTDVKIINVGSGAQSQTSGIYLPSGQASIDYHTCIEHRVPHCNSKEIFRGIIADKAKATFNGKIHIFRDAQKSDAQLSNKNLLLTNTAEINTKPELEIYADDVICAHGATVAKIDDASIFYLKSRGISDSKARTMISVGFINELLAYIKNDSIKNILSKLVQNRLTLL